MEAIFFSKKESAAAKAFMQWFAQMRINVAMIVEEILYSDEVSLCSRLSRLYE